QTCALPLFARRRRHLAVVTEDQVVAVTGHDRVHTLAADDEIVARASGDGVDATVARLSREDPVDIERVAVVSRKRGAYWRPDGGVEAAVIARGPVDVARVADHDVAALAGEGRGGGTA